MNTISKVIVGLIVASGISGVTPVSASAGLADPAVKTEMDETSYARELKALLKRHQHEWDAMIKEQSEAMKAAEIGEKRNELAAKHRDERKEMEARHSAELTALKEEHKG